MGTGGRGKNPVVAADRVSGMVCGEEGRVDRKYKKIPTALCILRLKIAGSRDEECAGAVESETTVGYVENSVKSRLSMLSVTHCPTLSLAFVLLPALPSIR